ncbi:MAG: putative LPS assembly protein LptD [Bacteroidota bacterium]|nr:putative LPS assembly protein LptD [Bacteroidota bacterium]
MKREIIAALFFPLLTAAAQDTPPDTVGTRLPGGTPRRADSLIVTIRDTSGKAADTTFAFRAASSADTLIRYDARDSIVYDLREKKMRLYGSASIVYGKTGITAQCITVNWDSSTIAARGIPDTSSPGRMTGTPVLKEGDETYHGLEMVFHFRTKKGVITQASTEMEGGYYLGERIKRMSGDAYFVAGGKYTTCDNPAAEKHYYFGSPKMKVVPNDIIVAEPIVLYIADIPLFALPFAVIPSKSGRSSGIIIPAFGDDYARGRYFRGGGYYLAASDYWDAKLTGDWYAKGGWRLSLNAQYALRYSFNGSLTASYGRQQFRVGSVFEPDDKPRTDYNISLRHSQEIDPTSRLSVDFSFLSDSYYQSFSNNLNELLNQSVRSAAGYSTSWEGTNRSLSVNVSREQNLQNGTSVNVLPDISFNQSQIFPFRRKSPSAYESWYEQIGFNYAVRGLHTLESRKRVVAGATRTDVFSRRGIQHSVGLILSPKFGYFTVQPSFSFLSRWYDHRIERTYDAAAREVIGRDAYGFFTINTFQLAMSASTKLYGTIQPNVAGILGIRHTLQPSISYSYNPDFSSAFWGYYRSYADSLGREVRYDPYSGYADLPGEVFSGAGMGESQTIGMGLSNVFEMKIVPAEGDTTETPRKFQLLNLGFSTSYNVARDSMKLAPVSASFRTSVQNLLDMYGGATFSPYVYRPTRYGTDSMGARVTLERGHEIDRFLFTEGQGLARLTAFDIHVSANLSNETFSRSARNDSAAQAGAWRVPWSLSVGYDYAINRFSPEAITRSSSMRASLTISPTRGWRLSASTYYDFITGQIGTPQVNVYRDLHCWEMTFNWVPAGYYRHYELVIRLKAPHLQDIKIEKKGSDRGVY